jgi:TolB-like protein
VKRLLLILLLSRAALAGSVVLLPVDNDELAPLIVKAVEAKGWQVKRGDEIEALLEQERVRYLDSIDARVREKILEKSGANAILSVTVYLYKPAVGLSARLIDRDGVVVWANVAAVAPSDTERVLGLERKDVSVEAVEALLRDFRRSGSPTRPPKAAGWRTRPTFYLSPELDRSRPICVLPFDNHSRVTDASRVLADVLALRLAAAGFRVVDPVVLRDAALKARISLHGVSSPDLALLAKSVGTPLFLRGTIYAYNESPSIDVEATLVDAVAGKVLWASQQSRKGSDYIGFLMLGAVSNSVSLSDRVAAEMIATARTKHEKFIAAGPRAHTGAGER